jgi:DNA sulfur modification protein DndD
MKLLSLRLENFRQFENQVVLEFAHGPGRNVTVIHGANGSGKTALLNAFTWVLYGQFTDALENPDNLVNRRVLMRSPVGDFVNCAVELVFDHDETKYRLRRTRTVKRTDVPPYWELVGEDEHVLQFAASGGKWETADQADISDILGRVIPEKLLFYFFFDGERIGQLQRPDKREETASATALLTGDEVLALTARHLGEVAKRFEQHLKTIGDAETSALISEKQELEEEMGSLGEGIQQHLVNIRGFEEGEKAISERLRELAETKHLQEERDMLRAREQDVTEDMRSLRDKVVNLVSEKGYLPLLKPAIDKSLGIIKELYESGKIPSDIKKPFVESLLQRQRCICDRPLTKGEPCYEAVEQWLRLSGMSSIEEKAISRRRDLQKAAREEQNFWQELNDLQSQRERRKTELFRIEERLNEIAETLRHAPQENIRELELALEQNRNALVHEAASKKSKQDKIEELRAKTEEINGEIQRREAKSLEQELTKKRIAVCLEAKAVLEDVRELHRDVYRKDLSERINKIFKRMLFKEYTAVLDDDYRLEVQQDASAVPVGASTGENQLLSLAFIAGVIEQAQEVVSRANNMLAPNSSDFPLVMDSPFGQLDYNYRGAVADTLPSLANQVVFLFTKAQSDGVMQSLEKRIGREYVLSYASPKEGVQADYISCRGKTYELVKPARDGHEKTEILEVI